MHRVGFDVSKINFITAVYGKKDKDCLEIYKRIRKLPREKGLHQPINSPGAAGILKTYHKHQNQILTIYYIFH